MSFTAITSGEITTGKPVSALTQNKIKDNFDDHESRLQTAELFTESFPNIVLRVNGRYPVVDSVVETTVNETMTIVGVFLIIDQAGSSGTTQIDLKTKRGVGSFTSIFTTKPSVLFSAGNDAVSSNGVLDVTKVDLQAGDIIRLDTTSFQVNGISYMVRIDYTRNP